MGGGLFDGLGQAVDGVVGAVLGVFESPADAVAQGADGRLEEQEAQSLADRALTVMAEVLECDVEALQPETDLRALGAEEESLAVMAWLLEAELDLEGLLEEADDWQTVGSVLFGIGEEAAAEQTSAA
ncbi:hypothetical protein [Kitasatospora sp. LaBMicrA B282]|uniref:hypothetical protein n=1 Tax=Kitasatospora sp. LaBMicrA B282 TaxID=3420949 RepID=UPI003D0EB722